MYTEKATQCIDLLDELVELIQESNTRILADGADPFFKDNANFLNKSFLTMACSYLESFLKEVSQIWVDDAKSRILAARIPGNFVRWEISQKPPKSDSDFRPFQFSTGEKEIEENLSGNPYRTREFFSCLGIKLAGNPKWEIHREHIQTIVTKRNRIIHHNDDASDLSFGDIEQYIQAIKNYIKDLADIINSQNHS